MIHHLKKRIPRGGFVRNVLTLMTGTTIAQAIPIAISPILTRLYTPADFGIFALYMAIAYSIAVIVTGRYELAIMLPKRDKNAISLTVLAIGVSVLVSLIVLGLFTIFGTKIAKLLNNPDISIWLYFIPLSILLMGIFESLDCWSTRKQQYKRSAISRVTRSLVTSAVSLAMGLFTTLGASGLIIGAILGQAFAVIVLGHLIDRDDQINVKSIKLPRILANAKKHKDFPIYSAPPALLDTTSLQAPILLINQFYDSAVAGFFNLTQRVIGLPMALIGGAVEQVYFQKLSHAKNQGEPIGHILIKTALHLFLIGLPITIVLMIAGPILFAFVFGEEWRVAGEYAQIISIAFLVRFAVSPITAIFAVTGHLKECAKWQVIYFLTTFSVLGFGAFSLEIKDFLLLYVIHEVILYLYYFYLSIKVSKLCVE